MVGASFEAAQPKKTIEELDLVEGSNKKVKIGEGGLSSMDTMKCSGSHRDEVDDQLRHKVSCRDSLLQGTKADDSMDERDEPKNYFSDDKSNPEGNEGEEDCPMIRLLAEEKK